jgi:phosphoglycolate phosphatase-like HAD superfamily hydrolase
MEKAGLDPARTVVVGDTVWDVEAASRCGLACICVTTGGISEAELREAGAVAVHDSPGALLESLGANRLGAHLA